MLKILLIKLYMNYSKHAHGNWQFFGGISFLNIKSYSSNGGQKLTQNNSCWLGYCSRINAEIVFSFDLKGFLVTSHQNLFPAVQNIHFKTYKI